MDNWLENQLVRIVMGKDSDSLWIRLVPPNYLYSRNSFRMVMRRGIHYKLDISDYLEHAIYFDYCDKGHEELRRIANNCNVIIDVGVNIGSTLLNFASERPNAKIFGFEPDSNNFGKAMENIGLNEFTNIKLVKKGLGETTHAAKLYEVNVENAGMNRILSQPPEGNDDAVVCREIDVITLDSFFEEEGLSEIDLIKIDVEGYELKVLLGASQLLTKYSPTLFIELDDGNLRVQNASAKELIRFVTDLSYECYKAETMEIIDGNDDFENCHYDIVCKIAR